jgi:serine/threonine protein kinase
VSDFGLTKFKAEMKRTQPNQLQGSLHWTAPEILNESDGVDYTLADVYSFGAALPPRALTPHIPHHHLRANIERVGFIRNHSVGTGDQRATLPGNEANNFPRSVCVCVCVVLRVASVIIFLMNFDRAARRRSL